MILAGPDGFFRPCSRHRVRPSYGDFLNSFAMKARAGPYGSYDNLNYYMANPVLGKSLCSDWFFLGQDFAVRTVSTETVQPVYFCFGAKPANSKFATKTAKKNCEYCHSSQGNYQKKLKRLKFFRNFKF